MEEVITLNVIPQFFELIADVTENANIIAT
jgi:hypothetical protein